jgi:uncharacterized caspase-like protein
MKPIIERDVSTNTSRQLNAAGGRQFVVAIGINQYRNWPRLHNAVNDARGALRVFKQLGFEASVPPLIDEQATADAMRRLVVDDLEMLRQSDSLILFFAGHGHMHVRSLHGPASVKTGYIIPADADQGRVATWLRLDNWLSDVAQLEARHILVIIDACHSGIALGSLLHWRAQVGLSTASLEGLHRRSRRVITSAMDGQRAMDSGPLPGHSLFTGCLIEGLTGGLAGEGKDVATGSDLGIYVQRRVMTYPDSRQTPDFGAFELDDRGELVIPLAMQARPVVAPAEQAATESASRRRRRDIVSGCRSDRRSPTAGKYPRRSIRIRSSPGR